MKKEDEKTMLKATIKQQEAMEVTSLGLPGTLKERLEYGKAGLKLLYTECGEVVTRAVSNIATALTLGAGVAAYTAAVGSVALIPTAVSFVASQTAKITSLYAIHCDQIAQYKAANLQKQLTSIIPYSAAAKKNMLLSAEYPQFYSITSHMKEKSMDFTKSTHDVRKFTAVQDSIISLLENSRTAQKIYKVATGVAMVSNIVGVAEGLARPLSSNLPTLPPVTQQLADVLVDVIGTTTQTLDVIDILRNGSEVFRNPDSKTTTTLSKAFDTLEQINGDNILYPQQTRILLPSDKYLKAQAYKMELENNAIINVAGMYSREELNEVKKVDLFLQVEKEIEKLKQSVSLETIVDKDLSSLIKSYNNVANDMQAAQKSIAERQLQRKNDIYVGSDEWRAAEREHSEKLNQKYVNENVYPSLTKYDFKKDPVIENAIMQKKQELSELESRIISGMQGLNIDPSSTNTLKNLESISKNIGDLAEAERGIKQIHLAVMAQRYEHIKYAEIKSMSLENNRAQLEIRNKKFIERYNQPELPLKEHYKKYNELLQEQDYKEVFTDAKSGTRNTPGFKQLEKDYNELPPLADKFVQDSNTLFKTMKKLGMGERQNFASNEIQQFSTLITDCGTLKNKQKELTELQDKDKVIRSEKTYASDSGGDFTLGASGKRILQEQVKLYYKHQEENPSQEQLQQKQAEQEKQKKLQTQKPKNRSMKRIIASAPGMVAMAALKRHVANSTSAISTAPFNKENPRNR